MSVTLRTIKGSALTYDEMDRNQAQFFYSSSVHDSNSKLRLHYTGSENLDLPGENYGPRYTEILFPSVDIDIPDPTAAGSDTQIQFNDNGTFGADSQFTFTKLTKLLGIGTSSPTTRIDIQGSGAYGGDITLRGAIGGIVSSQLAKIQFNTGNEVIGRIGKIDISNPDDIYFTNDSNIPLAAGTYGKLRFNIIGNEVATFSYDGNIPHLGIGTTNPSRNISIIGSSGIGIAPLGSVTGDESYITHIPSSLYNQTVGGLKKLIPNGSDPAGLLLSSPQTADGGNIVVSIVTDLGVAKSSQTNGFNIISADDTGNYDSSEVIASFQANGKVGINTNFPTVTGLTVEGIISGSSSANFDGQIKGKYALLATDTTDLELNTTKVVKVPVANIITFTSAIGVAGTEATVIIQGPVGARTISFDPTDFAVTGTLTATTSLLYTICFVSDGTRWYETSRTAGMT